MTARLSRAADVHTTEIIDYSRGRFSRRLAGSHGPASTPALLDDDACRELINELEAELLDPPVDVTVEDLRTFLELLRRSMPVASS
jgi:hypothetical protein